MQNIENMLPTNKCCKDPKHFHSNPLLLLSCPRLAVECFLSLVLQCLTDKEYKLKNTEYLVLPESYFPVFLPKSKSFEQTFSWREFRRFLCFWLFRCRSDCWSNCWLWFWRARSWSPSMKL